MQWGLTRPGPVNRCVLQKGARRAGTQNRMRKIPNNSQLMSWRTHIQGLPTPTSSPEWPGPQYSRRGIQCPATEPAGMRQISLLPPPGPTWNSLSSAPILGEESGGGGPPMLLILTKKSKLKRKRKYLVILIQADPILQVLELPGEMREGR